MDSLYQALIQTGGAGVIIAGLLKWGIPYAAKAWADIHSDLETIDHTAETLTAAAATLTAAAATLTATVDRLLTATNPSK